MKLSRSGVPDKFHRSVANLSRPGHAIVVTILGTTSERASRRCSLARATRRKRGIARRYDEQIEGHEQGQAFQYPITPAFINSLEAQCQ
jgi:hypothetical protein